MSDKQRFGLFVATVFWLVSVACGVSGPNDTSNVKPKPPGSLGAAEILYESLPETSEAVCAYEVKLVNGLSFWDESGTFSETEFAKARVGTRFLLEGTLSAKPGWSWVYEDENSSPQEGYFCKKKDGQ